MGLQYSPSGRTGFTTRCNWLELKDNAESSADADVEDEEDDLEEDEDDKTASLDTEVSLTGDKGAVLLTTCKATVLPTLDWALMSKSSPSSSSSSWERQQENNCQFCPPFLLLCKNEAKRHWIRLLPYCPGDVFWARVCTVVIWHDLWPSHQGGNQPVLASLLGRYHVVYLHTQSMVYSKDLKTEWISTDGQRESVPTASAAGASLILDLPLVIVTVPVVPVSVVSMN